MKENTVNIKSTNSGSEGGLKNTRTMTKLRTGNDTISNDHKTSTQINITIYREHHFTDGIKTEIIHRKLQKKKSLSA